MYNSHSIVPPSPLFIRSLFCGRNGIFYSIVVHCFRDNRDENSRQFGRNKEDLLRSVIFRVENYYSSDQNIKGIIGLRYFFVCIGYCDLFDLMKKKKEKEKYFLILNNKEFWMI